MSLSPSHSSKIIHSYETFIFQFSRQKTLIQQIGFQKKNGVFGDTLPVLTGFFKSAGH